MSEHSIEELLGRLPQVNSPDPDFEARLRSRLEAEWKADQQAISGGDPTGPSSNHLSEMEVIELQTLTRTPTDPPKARRRYLLRAAAVIAVITGAVAVLVAIQRDDEPPATNPTPQTTTPPTVATTQPKPQSTAPPSTAAKQPNPETTLPNTIAVTAPPQPSATFVGATLATFPVDLTFNPYFVGAENEVWVSSLAGELVRLDSVTGEIVARATAPQSSPFAVDANAVWVADALSGDVIRLDPVDGHEVARIPTGVEILDNSFRQPMLEGTAQSLAQIGGIISTGDAVWVGDKAGAVMGIDPVTNTIMATFDVPVRPDVLRADGQQLLVADLLGAGVAVINTDDGSVVYDSGRLDDMAGAALYSGAVYRQDRATGTVTRVDLATGDELSSIALGPPQERSGTPTLPTGLVVSEAGILVDTTTVPDSLHVLDPRTLDEIGTLPTTPDQGDMTIAVDGSVWLVRSLAHEIVHITPVAP